MRYHRERLEAARAHPEVGPKIEKLDREGAYLAELRRDQEWVDGEWRLKVK